MVNDLYHNKLKKFTGEKNKQIFYSSRTRNCYILWHFGNICNFRCSYCLNKYASDMNFSNITKEQTDKIIKQLNKIKTAFKVDFLGGEPTLFKYCFYAIKRLNCYGINITTNGYETEWIRELYNVSREYHKHVILCVSVHYEKYLEDKEDYINHLDALIEMSKEKSNVELEFMILLNYKYLDKYKELVQYLCDREKTENYNINMSYVRYDSQPEEFVKNYAKASKMFSDDIAEKLKNERLRAITKNPFYHKNCSAFKYYMNINMDGTVTSCDCPQQMISKKSMYDDDFDISKEITVMECCQKHERMNSSCRVANNMLK